MFQTCKMSQIPYMAFFWPVTTRDHFLFLEEGEMKKYFTSLQAPVFASAHQSKPYGDELFHCTP